MKIKRKPRVGGHWSDTDQKKPQEYVENWQPGTIVVVDGTIDKDGSRHLQIGIELTEDDVQALINKMIKHYQDQLQGMQDKYDNLLIECDQLKAGFHLLEDMVDPYVHPDLFHTKAASMSELLHGLFELAQFGTSPEITNEVLPEIPWLSDEEE